jgi:Raf kinase inhibitor-like YbhB/YbcL family protein
MRDMAGTRDRDLHLAPVMAFRITSPAFSEGGTIPTRHSCDGENRSPRLTWSDAPDGTESFALIVDDPDAPGGTFTHWVLYNVPGDAGELAEAAAQSSVGMSGRNSFGKIGYGGPCPPPGDPPHRYRFTLHALDIPSIELSRDAEREQVEAEIEGHILGSAQLVGRYQRQAGARRGAGTGA